VTEAGVDFEPPVSVEDALAICRRHRVTPTQLISHTTVGGESLTTGVMVDPGMSEEAIAEEFRHAGGPAPLIGQMYATGNAGDLQALKSEPAVHTVFLKPPSASVKR
jgi:hypothetical protein